MFGSSKVSLVARGGEKACAKCFQSLTTSLRLGLSASAAFLLARRARDRKPVPNRAGSLLRFRRASSPGDRASQSQPHVLAKRLPCADAAASPRCAQWQGSEEFWFAVKRQGLLPGEGDLLLLPLRGRQARKFQVPGRALKSCRAAAPQQRLTQGQT
jgi:hypothetical protein